MIPRPARRSSSRLAPLALALLAAGCAGAARGPAAGPAEGGAVTVAAPGAAGLRPAPRPDLAARPAPAAPGGARSPEAFDRTSPEERAAAAAPAPSAGRLLGRTIAALGAPTEPGFWLETPLVTAPQPGRIVLRGSGAEARVELRPSGGAPGSGSRLSLAAFRLLGLGLTALPELEVYGL